MRGGVGSARCRWEASRPTSQLLDRRSRLPRSGWVEGLAVFSLDGLGQRARRDIGHAEALAIRSTVP